MKFSTALPSKKVMAMVADLDMLDTCHLVEENTKLRDLLCRATIELEAIEDCEDYCRRAEAAEIAAQAKELLGIEDCHRG